MAKGSAETVMPVSALQDDLRARRFDAFHIAGASVHRHLMIASPPESRLSPAMHRSIDIVRQQFSALSDEGMFQRVPHKR